MKKVATITVFADGTVALAGKLCSWDEAHAAITAGRKHNQIIRKAATKQKRESRATEKRAKLEARKAKLEAQLAKLNGTAEVATA